MTHDEKAKRYDNALERAKKVNIGLKSPDYYQGKVDALNDTLSLIETIEMKVDACYEKILKLYE